MIRDSNAFRSRTGKLCHAYSDQFAGFLKLGQLNMLCREKVLPSRSGRTEVTPSRRFEVIERLGANGCRQSSWSELDGKFAERIPVFWTSQVFMALAPFFHRMVR